MLVEPHELPPCLVRLLGSRWPSNRTLTEDDRAALQAMSQRVLEDMGATQDQLRRLLQVMPPEALGALCSLFCHHGEAKAPLAIAWRGAGLSFELCGAVDPAVAGRLPFVAWRLLKVGLSDAAGELLLAGAAGVVEPHPLRGSLLLAYATLQDRIGPRPPAAPSRHALLEVGAGLAQRKVLAAAAWERLRAQLGGAAAEAAGMAEAAREQARFSRLFEVVHRCLQLQLDGSGARLVVLDAAMSLTPQQLMDYLEEGVAHPGGIPLDYLRACLAYGCQRWPEAFSPSVTDLLWLRHGLAFEPYFGATVQRLSAPADLDVEHLGALHAACVKLFPRPDIDDLELARLFVTAFTRSGSGVPEVVQAFLAALEEVDRADTQAPSSVASFVRNLVAEQGRAAARDARFWHALSERLLKAMFDRLAQPGTSPEFSCALFDAMLAFPPRLLQAHAVLFSEAFLTGPQCMALRWLWRAALRAAAGEPTEQVLQGLDDAAASQVESLTGSPLAVRMVAHLLKLACRGDRPDQAGIDVLARLLPVLSLDAEGAPALHDLSLFLASLQDGPGHGDELLQRLLTVLLDEPVQTNARCIAIGACHGVLHWDPSAAVSHRVPLKDLPARARVHSRLSAYHLCERFETKAALECLRDAIDAYLSCGGSADSADDLAKYLRGLVALVRQRVSRPDDRDDPAVGIAQEISTAGF